MLDNEDFYLGKPLSSNINTSTSGISINDVSTNDEDSFYLGSKPIDTTIFTHSNVGSPITSIEVKAKAKAKETLDFRQVQKLLELEKLVDSEDKHDSTFMEEYLSSNEEVFTVMGKGLYEDIFPSDYASFLIASDRWRQEARKVWIASNKRNINRMSNFEAAITSLKNAIKTKERYKSFCQKVRAKLQKQLRASIDEKLSNGVLSIQDINTIVNSAIRTKVITPLSKDVRFLISELKNYAKGKGCHVESVDDSICRIVSSFSAIQRLDTPKTIDGILVEYKRLKDIEAALDTIPIKAIGDLRGHLTALLKTKGLLVDKVKYYMENFYAREKASSGYNYNLAINSEYYYYLKGTATYIYQFSAEDWDEFTYKEGIKKEDDSSIAFIMGEKKAISLPDIARMLEANPFMAEQRIRAGDLATYLEHIGQASLKASIDNLRLQGAKDIVSKAVTLIDSAIGIVARKESLEHKSKSQYDLIDEFIKLKSSPHDIVQRLEEAITSSSIADALYKDLLEGNGKTKELCSYLETIGFTLDKVFIDILAILDLPTYAYIYEAIAASLLDSIAKRQDGKDIFNLVLKPIIAKDLAKLSVAFGKVYNRTQELISG